MTCISRSSDFAIYLENCSVAEHRTLGLLVNDLKCLMVTVTYISWPSDFALYLDGLMFEHYTL